MLSYHMMNEISHVARVKSEFTCSELLTRFAFLQIFLVCRLSLLTFDW